jgi:hypothetical protein
MTTALTPAELLVKIQHDALAEYLSAFPEDKPYSEVLKMIETDDHQVLVWELFDHYPVDTIIEIIEGRLEANKRILQLAGVPVEE